MQQFFRVTREIAVRVKEMPNVAPCQELKQSLVLKNGPVVASLCFIVEFVLHCESTRLVERVIVQPTHLAIVEVDFVL